MLKLPSTTISKIFGVRVFRYIIAGATSFIIENLVFIIGFYLLSFSSIYSNILSITVALIFNFFASKYFVFMHRKKIRISEVVSYGGIIFFNLIATSFLINLLITNGFSGYSAKFIAAASAAFWTYMVFKKVVFRHEV